MEIHDLNTGTPAALHYLAMDTGSDTYKTTLDALCDKIPQKILTTSFTNNGITLRLYYLRACPNIMLVKMTGKLTEAVSTSDGYFTVANANDFLTAAVGARTAALTKYFFFNVYVSQLAVETGGAIKIGYTRRLTDGTICDLPSGTSFYIEEMILLK